MQRDDVPAVLDHVADQVIGDRPQLPFEGPAHRTGTDGHGGDGQPPAGGGLRDLLAARGQRPVVREGAAQGLGPGVRPHEGVPDGGVDALAEGTGVQEPVDVPGLVPGQHRLRETGHRVEAEPPGRPAREKLLGPRQPAQQ